MSVQPPGIAEIQARIAEIQARFVPTVAAAAGATTTTATSGSSADFAVALAQLSSSGLRAGSTTSAAAATAEGSGGGTGTATGDAIVADARKYLGIPYVWGGTDPSKGFDCSGLVQYVYHDLGIDLPRGSRAQATKGTEVPSLAAAQPGDLVTFGVPANHIGIYIGNNKMIVAPHTGDVVKVENVYEKPSHIRRIVSSSTTSVAAPAAPATTTAAGSTTVAAGSSPAMKAAPAAYRSLFTQAGRRYGVSPDLLAAVAQTESGFRSTAVSPAGARGLMQLMPATAKGLGVDAMDPTQAVDGAARLLARNLHTFGSTTLALAAYNAGPGAVQKYKGVPPYPETRAYVTKVLKAAGRSS